MSFPDQVWVADITYIRLLTEFVYLAIVMAVRHIPMRSVPHAPQDVFTRAMRGWHLGRALDQNLTLTALRQALEERCPEIHHSDQGVHATQRSHGLHRPVDCAWGAHQHGCRRRAGRKPLR